MMKVKLKILFFLSASILACKETAVYKSEELSIKSENLISSKQQIIDTVEAPIEITDSACKCFHGIGSTENDKPIITSTFSNGTSVSLCGFFDKEMRGQGLIMSEFNVFDCETGNALVEYGAVKICRIEVKKDTLSIYELKYLPVGTKWSWELIQIGKQELILHEGKLITYPQVPELEKFTIDEDQQNQFLGSLKKGDGFSSEWESDLGKLEVLSLLGNDSAWEILKNYEDFTGDKTDGALAEQWKDAIAIVEWLKQE